MRTVFLLTLLPLLGIGGETRDPWRWPFASDSIWNTPVGSGAVYEPAGIAPVGAVGIDWEPLFRVPEGAPQRPLFAPASWERRVGGAKHLPPVRIGDEMLVPDAHPGFAPNYCAALLMPDGRTVRHLGPLARPAPGGSVYSYHFGESDLHGDGIAGSHGGSGMSALGGSIRLGELTGDAPLRRALKACLQTARDCYFGEDRPGFRWPATRTDGYADAKTYGGKNKAVVMGSLLALKPELTADALGLKTPVARKLFQALQDFGVYLVDDSAADAFFFCGELGLSEEVRERFGHAPEEWPELRADINALLPHLHVVENNALASIGGGGPPRVALAPPIGAMDQKAPSAPGRVRIAEVTAHSVALQWDVAADDTGVGGYEVFAGGRKVGATFGATILTVGGWQPETALPLKVRARDRNGNVSPFTTELVATTDPLPPGLIVADFDSRYSPGWSLEHAMIDGGALHLRHWEGRSRAVHRSLQVAAPFELTARLAVAGSGPANFARLHFYHRDERNTAYLELTAGAPGAIRLRRVQNGATTTLAEMAGRPRGEFALSFEEDGAITVRCDGRVLFERVADPAPAEVRAGGLMFAGQHTEASLDGLRIDGPRVRLEPEVVFLESPLRAAEWRLDHATQPSDTALKLTHWNGRATARYLGPETSLPCLLSADFATTGAAAGNIARFDFCHRDERNTCALIISGRGPGARLTLTRVLDGQRKTLASAIGWEGGRIEIALQHGEVEISLVENGERRVLCRGIRDAALRQGAFGFGAEYNLVTITNPRAEYLAPVALRPPASSGE